MNESLKLTLEEANMEDLLTVIFFHVDEFYRQVAPVASRPGPEPGFSDSEVITLSLVGQMANDSETAFHKFIKRNHMPLFPKLIDRTRFNRRSRGLFKLTNLIRQMINRQMGVDVQQWHVADSLPVPVCGLSRAGRSLHFAAQFGLDHQSLYGYCAAKDQHFYGFRLHLLVTAQGTVAHFVLAPASYHDVKVAPELLESYRCGITVGGDKGYVGLDKLLSQSFQCQLVVQNRRNQASNTDEEKSFLALFRKIVETTNSQLTEQFSIQYTRAKSAWGLMSRVIGKITAHTLALYLNMLAGRPLLSVKSIMF